MKRGGFTLIELIFVIVVIGILAAVAVPKFKNLKQNAEANAVVKTTIDGAQSAVSSAVNFYDLEGNTSIELSDILQIKGKNWVYTDNATATDHNGSYEFKNQNGNVIAGIYFYGYGATPSRVVEYKINCNNFTDPKSQEVCTKDINNTSVDVNITF